MLSNQGDDEFVCFYHIRDTYLALFDVLVAHGNIDSAAFQSRDSLELGTIGTTDIGGRDLLLYTDRLVMSECFYRSDEVLIYDKILSLVLNSTSLS